MGGRTTRAPCPAALPPFLPRGSAPSTPARGAAPPGPPASASGPVLERRSSRGFQLPGELRAPPPPFRGRGSIPQGTGSSPHRPAVEENPRGAARARAPHQPSANKSPPTNRRPKGNRRPEFGVQRRPPGCGGTAGATPAHPQSKKPTLESRCPGMFRRRWGRRNVPPRDPAPRSDLDGGRRVTLSRTHGRPAGGCGWATGPGRPDPGCAIA